MPNSTTAAPLGLASSSIIPNGFIDFGDVGEDQAKDRSPWRAHPQPAAASTGRGEPSVKFQNVQFDVWLALAVLAVVWAHVQIWQVRRVLNRIRQDLGEQPGRSVSSAVAELRGSIIATDSGGSHSSWPVHPEQARRPVGVLASDRGRRLLANGPRQRRPAPTVRHLAYWPGGRGEPDQVADRASGRARRHTASRAYGSLNGPPRVDPTLPHGCGCSPAS